MMKKGDTVLCIKYYSLNKSDYHSGKHYIIEDCGYLGDWRVKLCRINGVYFYLNEKDIENNARHYSPFFDNYFIDLRSERKEKLQILKNYEKR